MDKTEKKILNLKLVEEKFKEIDLGKREIEIVEELEEIEIVEELEEIEIVEELEEIEIVEELEEIEDAEEIGLSPEVAEDYIRLSDNILELNLKKSIKTIAVSSSIHGEGTSSVAFNLAIALAKDRASNILLIDGNLRRPSLHSFLGLEKDKGLTEMILGEINLDGALMKSTIPNLLFMTSGNLHIAPNRIFTSGKFKEFVNAIGNHFEFVIFDSPPINQYPDSTILSTLLDGTLLVIQAERVIYEVIQKAREKIESNGGKILGVVLNRRKYYIPDMIYRKL